MNNHINQSVLMTIEQKNIAVETIKAILIKEKTGIVTANEIVQATYRNWTVLNGSVFSDFEYIVNTLKGELK